MQLPTQVSLGNLPVFTDGLFFAYTAQQGYGDDVMNVEISQDVPLPKPHFRYPYGAMQVGDSFLVPGGKLQIVCNANYRAGKRLGRRFTARKDGDGVRVWRLA
jgi:hypothetical protein